MSKVTLDKTSDNALNKDFLQKIQPTTYGKDLIRYFESRHSRIEDLIHQLKQFFYEWD